MNLFLFSFIIIAVGLITLMAKRLFGIASDTKAAGLVILIIGCILMTASFLFTIDEGEAIVLIQFGKLYDTISTPGIHLKRPWAEVHVYPKRLREYSMVIQVRTGDGMEVSIDTTSLFKVNTEQIGTIYKDIAIDMDVMTSKILMPILRTTIRDTISQYDVKQLYEARAEISKKIAEDAKKALKEKYIILDKLLIREIKLPPEIEKSVQLKIQAQQEAEAAEYKKQKAIKEAEIKIEEAKGVAEANKIINRTLTVNYLQHEAIQTYKELANSKNTTFVIMPTNPKGAGMPLIIGGTK